METVQGEALDVSMFTRGDLANLVLQRSEVLHDVERPGRIIRAWSGGDPAPLEAQVDRLGPEIAHRAHAAIAAEFAALAPVLERLKPAVVADIGCGYGLADLMIYRATGAQLQLIDIEENENRHFGFAEEGSAYADLAKARAFLEGNGVPGAAIATCNPKRERLDDLPRCDLAISLLSCGFHYPVEIYMDFFTHRVKPGGAIVLTLRERATQEDSLAGLGRLTRLDWGRKGAALVLVEKG